MASVFTQILAGTIPGRIVWEDEQCFAILTNRPIRAGHTLVIPKQEVDHWLDLEPALSQHLFEAARSVGRGIQQTFHPMKVGMVIAGIEVRHVHLHLIPIDAVADLDFARQDPDAKPADLDRAASALRDSLRALGYTHVHG